MQQNLMYECMNICMLQVVGFVWGLVCQQFIQTLYIFTAGVFLACLVSYNYSGTNNIVLSNVLL